MKRRVFWSVFFTVSFRLPIYESVAAIFWQSASYVCGFVIFLIFLLEQDISTFYVTILRAVGFCTPNKTRKFILILQFFSRFLKIYHFLVFFSPRRQGTPLGFYIRLLHCF